MSRHSISDTDLVKIFSYDQRIDQYKSALWTIIRGAFVFLAILLLTYLVTNFYALRAKFAYWYDNDLAISTEDVSQKESSSPASDTSEIKKPDLPSISPNTISIAAIGVNAPVIWQVNNIDKELTSKLENGVIQLNGTALPGQVGNIYITGHSSNYSWARGSFNNVFALLDKLVPGDTIYMNYKDIIYSYTVSSTKVVAATDMSVLAQSSDSRLSLVTCWPVGTSLKRLVVIATQTIPDPKNNTSVNGKLNANSLPSGR